MGIIQNYTSNKLNFTVYMDQVQKYMSGKDLKIDLQTRVLEYVNFVYAGVYINEANVKKLLSGNSFYSFKATIFLIFNFSLQRDYWKTSPFIAAKSSCKTRF